jgi:hypothetical protein
MSKLNTDIKYYVVDAKLNIIEKFVHSWTAYRFKVNKNKDYFGELMVMTKEEYEDKIKKKK